MIESIIFDFDGVLVESVDVKTKAFAEIFKPYGPKAVEDVVAFHLANGGVSRYEKFRHFYKEILRRPLPEERMTYLADHFADLVVEKVVAAPFVTGALAFLKKYSSILDLHVVSGTPEHELLEIMKRRDMLRYFKTIHGSPALKPTSTKVIVCEYHDPAVTVFVGDAMTDFEAARECGIVFIGRVDQAANNGSAFTGLRVPLIKDLTELAKVIGLER